MQFNPNDYETVEERIKRFYSLYEDGRIITKDVTRDADRERGIWEVLAYVYLDEGSQAADLPKATGYAFEVVGNFGANKTSALENCETSAIGRALANMNLSGNKRASREEMSKVANSVKEPVGAVSESTAAEWLPKYKEVKTVEQARELYAEAQSNGAPADVLESIKNLGVKLGKA